MKKWGKGEYWGVSSDYDPEWLLTENQKKLRDDLIELCRVKIRPHAVSTQILTYRTFRLSSQEVILESGHSQDWNRI